MPLADWDWAIAALSHRFLVLDRLSRVEEYMGDYSGRLQKLGRSGSFWTPG